MINQRRPANTGLCKDKYLMRRKNTTERKKCSNRNQAYIIFVYSG
jgi:hypothetical protein